MGAAGYGLAMCAMYGVWFGAWHEAGVRPIYGHPKSWQSEFVAGHRAFYDNTFPVLVFLFYSSPVWTIGAIVGLWRTLRERGRVVRNVSIFVGLLALIGIFLWDPLGVLFWYLD
jgi:hypothetical protein